MKSLSGIFCILVILVVFACRVRIEESTTKAAESLKGTVTSYTTLRNPRASLAFEIITDDSGKKSIVSQHTSESLHKYYSVKTEIISVSWKIVFLNQDIMDEILKLDNGHYLCGVQGQQVIEDPSIRTAGIPLVGTIYVQKWRNETGNHCSVDGR